MGIQGEYRARCARDTDITAHLGILYSWARRGGVMLELGVRSGNSTGALLAGAEAADSALISVDIEQPDVPGHWYDLPYWKLIVGHDQDPAVAAQVPSWIRLLFIDTSHQYADTIGELRLYGPRVAPGGVILLHDTDQEGVRRALDEYAPGWYNHARDHGLGVIEV
jgi:cephalosporin hydroxylase